MVSTPQFQSGVWTQLRRIAQSGLVGNGYIFSGPPGCGKEGMATAFAQFLNCENPSKKSCGSCPSCARFRALENEKLKLIVPLPAPKGKKIDTDSEDGNAVSQSDMEFLSEAIQEKAQNPFHKIRVPKANRILIQTVRELRKSLFLKDAIKGQKCIVIFDAHLLSVGQGETANALLKILEEPPESTTFILVTDHPALLLPTILSRCQTIQFPPLKADDVKAWLTAQGEDENVKFIAGLSQGNIHRSRKLMALSTEAIMDQLEAFIANITSKDPNAWRSFTQEIGRIAFQKPDELKFQFQMASLWMHGTFHLRKGMPLPIHETDLKPGMETFNQKYPNADLQSIVILFENTLVAKEMNLNMSLILTNLLLDIEERLNA